MEEGTKADQVVEAYRQQARNYDEAVRNFDIFSRFGFDISGWRTEAIGRLNLNNGDTVIDIGCGTGLNFPMLRQAVGESGRVIGVDLSEEMLVQAKERLAAHHWENFELVCIDAAQYPFPPAVDAVISAYTLTLVPDCRRVISNACAALVPGGRLVVVDMAWPKNCPLWWRHVLFFLRTYGVTKDVLKRRPWEWVQEEMKKQLVEVTSRSYWFGFFYLCSGTAQG